jgi:hypothetical protein
VGQSRQQIHRRPIRWDCQCQSVIFASFDLCPSTPPAISFFAQPTRQAAHRRLPIPVHRATHCLQPPPMHSSIASRTLIHTHQPTNLPRNRILAPSLPIFTDLPIRYLEQARPLRHRCPHDIHVSENPSSSYNTQIQTRLMK